MAMDATNMKTFKQHKTLPVFPVISIALSRAAFKTRITILFDVGW